MDSTDSINTLFSFTNFHKVLRQYHTRQINWIQDLSLMWFFNDISKYEKQNDLKLGLSENIKKRSDKILGDNML